VTALHRSPRPLASRLAPSTDAGDRLLALAATCFAFAVVFHNGDHLRRGADTVHSDVFWAGTSAVLVEVGVVVVVMQRHRLAPLAALATGASLAPAYVLVHFLPARSWLSDSLASAPNVSWTSWTAAGLEVLAAAALGLAGGRVLRERGGLASATLPHAEQAPARAGLLHPVALLLLAVDVVIVVASFSQR
jgi:hypothetical protein